MKYTAKEDGFINAVVGGSTQADAYRAHYKTDGWSNQAVAEAASKLAAKPKIDARIRELTQAKRKVAKGEFDIDVKRLLQTYVEIAFTDPNELTSMHRGACRHCWGAGGAYQWKEREYSEAVTKWQRDHARWMAKGGGSDEPELPDGSGGFGYMFYAPINPKCVECEGKGDLRMHVQDTTKLSPGAKHLYRGVQQTKDGIKVLFGDKDKALDSIGRMLGAFDDRLKLDLRGAVASLHLTTTDAQEAAKAYEKMLLTSSSS